MSKDDPKAETPVTNPEPKVADRDELAAEELDLVIGGDVSLGQRGSNGVP